MKFRPHRGSLDAALAEVQEFDGTRYGLQVLIDEECVRTGYEGDVRLENVDYYHFDRRIGWDTHIVTARHFDLRGQAGSPFVVGFTDGPVTK